MMNMNAQTRIIDLTVGELMTILAKQFENEKDEIVLMIESRMNKEVKEGPLQGVEGLCKALGCCKSKVMRMKKAGDLEGGYQQIGSTIYIKDPQALRDIAAHSAQKRKAMLNKINNVAV